MPEGRHNHDLLPLQRRSAPIAHVLTGATNAEHTPPLLIAANDSRLLANTPSVSATITHPPSAGQPDAATTARGTMASIIAACVLDSASQHMERLPRQNERPKLQPLRRPQVPLSSWQNQHPSSLRMRKSSCKRQQQTSATRTHLLHVQESPASFSTLAAIGLTSRPTSLNSCNSTPSHPNNSLFHYIRKQ